MDMKRKTWRWIIFILITVAITGCAETQPAAELSALPRIEVVFDGENCLVSGNDQITGSMILFDMDNQSDLVINLAIAELKGDSVAEEVFNTFVAGSVDFPDGVSYNARSDRLIPGADFEDLKLLLLTGNYAVLCEDFSTLEKFFGAGFTVP